MQVFKFITYIFLVHILIGSISYGAKVNAWDPVYSEDSILRSNNNLDLLLKLLKDEEVTSQPKPMPNIIGLVAEKEIMAKVGENGLFPISSANVGASGSIIIKMDTGPKNLPLFLRVCQTSPDDGTCYKDFSNTLKLEYESGETASFAVFYHAHKPIPAHYANSRIYIRYIDENTGIISGVTSVALSAK